MKKVVSRGDEVYNDEVFHMLVDYEVIRSVRYPSPVTLLTIEAEPTTLYGGSSFDTKAIFASKLNTLLRAVDIPGQGSGNKFTVLLPKTDSSGARSLCERLISVFRNKVTGGAGEEVAYTLNIGGACHPGGESLSTEGLFKTSEEALQQSKLKGPNTHILLNQ